MAQKDTSNADHHQGHGLPVAATTIRGEGEGIGFISTLLDTNQRIQSAEGKPQGDDYPSRWWITLVVPVGKKIRIITRHRQRRDPRLGFRAPVRRQQDAIPGFVCATILFQPRRPAISTASVRSGKESTRLHAHPRARAFAGRLHPLGTTRRSSPRPPTTL